MKSIVFSILILSIPALSDEVPVQTLNFTDFQAPDIELPKPERSPALAACLSIFPGMGHAYLGDFKAASGIFAGFGVLVGLSAWETDLQMTSLISAQNFFSYNIYAAYRDARTYNQNVGYRYQMPTETLSELLLAPLSWSVMKKPEVWGGVLGALTLAGVITVLFHEDGADARVSMSTESSIFPLAAFPIAIGEESLFRGFLQSALYDSLSPAGSIILSSLAFGAAHIPNALQFDDRAERRRYYAVSLPLITTFGAYFGYLAYKNCSLKESVAVHAWYDFTLFLAAYSVAQSAAIRRPSVAFSFSF